MPSVKLSKLQAEYLKAANQEKARIDRDISVAVGMALAGHGVDVTKDMTFGLDGNVLTYSTPEPQA